MTIAFVANQNDNFADSITSQALAYSSNNTVGNCLVAFVDILAILSSQIPAVFTVADSLGNLWLPGPRLDVPIGDQSDSRCCAFMYAPNCKAGANTVTLSTLGVTYNMGLAIQEYSGLDKVNPLSTVYSSGYSNLVSTQKKNPAINALRPDYINTVTIIGTGAEDSSPTVGTGWTDADDNTHLSVSYSILTATAYKVPNFVTGASNYYGIVSMTLHAGPSTSPPKVKGNDRVYSFGTPAAFQRPALGKGLYVGVLAGTTSALAGTASTSFGASGTLAGQGALSGNASCSFAASGAGVAAGALAGTASATFAATGSLTGTGALAGTASASFSATSTPALAGTASASFAATGTMTGTGALAGNAACSFDAQGTLSGPGALAGTAGCSFVAQGTLTGSGALAGNASCTFGATGALTGAGALAGTAAVSFGAAATAALAGAAACTFTASATPALEGSASCTFAGVASFNNLINGTAAASFAATAAIGATGALAGAASCVFGATAGTPSALVGTATCSFTGTGSLAGQDAAAGIAACSFAATATPASGILGGVASCSFASEEISAGALAGIASCMFTATGRIAPPPVPPGLGLFAVLQIGNTVAGQGRLNPRFVQGTNVPCLCSFFDPITQVATDPDMGTIAAVAIAPDGSTVTLTATRLGVGQYAAAPYASLAGPYNVRFTAALSGSEMLFEGQFTSVAPYQGTGVPSVNTWIFVNQTKSPYQGVAISPFVAVDLRQGAVSVQFPENPSDGDEFTVKDWYDLAGTVSSGTGVPGGPITLTADNGVTFENPAALGTYASTGTISVSGAYGKTWKYSLTADSWTIENVG